MLKYAPTNEQEVVYLFAMICRKLGFLARRVQTEFPDCILVDSQGNYVRGEFELRTSNFLQHGHALDQCDLVIAWEDDCKLSSQIPVIELKQHFQKLESDPSITKDDLALNKTRIVLSLIASRECTTGQLSELFDKYHPKERRKEPERLIARLVASDGKPFVEDGHLCLGKPIHAAQIVWSVAGREQDLVAARKILIDLGLAEYCRK